MISQTRISNITTSLSFRSELTAHPLDQTGNQMSLEVANLYLETKKKSRRNYVPSMRCGKTCSFLCKMLVFIFQFLLWCYVLVTDIFFIHEFRNINITGMFTNSTNNVSFQTITIDLYFTMMTAAMICYFVIVLVSISAKFYGRQSLTTLERSLSR